MWKLVHHFFFPLYFQDGEKEFSQAVLDERTKKAELWHRDAAVRAQYTKPAQPITCATFAQDVLEGRANVSQAHEHKHQPMIFGPASLVGGSLTSERERIAAQVFQPQHRYSPHNENSKQHIFDRFVSLLSEISFMKVTNHEYRRSWA